MQHTHRVFHAVTYDRPIGNNRAGDLLKWLERFVRLCFPDTGVEYWTNAHDIYAQGASAEDNPYVSPADSLPDCRRQFAAVSVSVTEGRSEGMRLVFRVHPRSAEQGRERILVEAKLFETRDRCWEIARAAVEALESILLWNEVPDIVEMSAGVLKGDPGRGALQTVLTHVTLRSTATSVWVVTAAGEELSHQSCGEDVSPSMATHRVAALLKDWFFVLSNAGVSRIDFEAVT